MKFSGTIEFGSVTDGTYARLEKPWRGQVLQSPTESLA